LILAIVAGCRAADIRLSRTPPPLEAIQSQVPVPGTVTAHWPSRLAVSSNGVVVVEVMALSDFPSHLGSEPRDAKEADGTMRRTIAVYVAPGDLELTLDTLPGLRIDEPAGSTKHVTAQRGTVVEASWSVRAMTTGQSGVILRAHRLARANPDEPLTARELGMLDIDDMELTLPLAIESVEARSTIPSTPATAPVQDSPPTGIDIAQLLTLGTLFFAAIQFVLWLVAEELDRRGRAPRVAAVIGWLPRTLRKYRAQDSKPDSSPKA